MSASVSIHSFHSCPTDLWLGIIRISGLLAAGRCPWKDLPEQITQAVVGIQAAAPKQRKDGPERLFGSSVVGPQGALACALIVDEVLKRV